MKVLCSLHDQFSMLLALMLLFPLVSRGQIRYPDFYPELNRFYSSKPLGATMAAGNTIFRLFAPNATGVTLVTFATHDSPTGKEFPMQKDPDGVWEYSLPGEQYGLYYGYRIHGRNDRASMFDPKVIVADPYARAVVTRNDYQHAARSLIVSDAYDWEGDTWMNTPIQDLIIYEMHVRDMTIHPSAGVEHAGTYLGLCETGRIGGLDYLLDLGINAVELLPCQEFANIEPPYNDSSAAKINSWNPYARNHWGYMTSYFFAPESYYATDGNLAPGGYCGIQGRQVTEFKDMVKALHRKGIAVIMDVVYNHVSDYDLNPFKYIDKKYYFRLDSVGRFLSYSGCGNDFMTERPMVR
ncbi:MAG: alpha-amylase family glycosyl hydrolase, partial [candidate division KSB1 bacterium]|nr:alpha-amylase family glycosyl hydrolase [candidate division KSB1 bacterium]